MKKLSVILLIIIYILVGCEEPQALDQNQEVEFVEDDMYIMIHDLEIEYLFSSACKIKNNTDEVLGPFYIRYLFHDEKLSIILKDYIDEQKYGLKPHLLNPNEPLICGSSVSIEQDKTNYDELYTIIKDKKSIEVQLVHAEDEQILANYFINEIKPLQDEKHFYEKSK